MIPHESCDGVKADCTNAPIQQSIDQVIHARFLCYLPGYMFDPLSGFLTNHAGPDALLTRFAAPANPSKMTRKIAGRLSRIATNPDSKARTQEFKRHDHSRKAFFPLAEKKLKTRALGDAGVR